MLTLLLFALLTVAATAFIVWETLARFLDVPSPLGRLAGAVASFVFGGTTGPRVQPQEFRNPLHEPASAPRRVV